MKSRKKLRTLSLGSQNRCSYLIKVQSKFYLSTRKSLYHILYHHPNTYRLRNRWQKRSLQAANKSKTSISFIIRQTISSNLIGSCNGMTDSKISNLKILKIFFITILFFHFRKLCTHPNLLITRNDNRPNRTALSPITFQLTFTNMRHVAMGEALFACLTHVLLCFQT